MKSAYVRAFVALLISIPVIAPSVALAGTTGAVRGTVRNTHDAPVAGARVTASSPSETEQTFADAHGSYAFVSLRPDTYTISVEKDGYDPLSRPGIVLFQDGTLDADFWMWPTMNFTPSLYRAIADLRQGGTASVWQANDGVQRVVRTIGGGGNLDSAYAAIASMPGVDFPIGSQGGTQGFFVRGDTLAQTGYEYDGVPTARAFDGYAGTTLSTIGQANVQLTTAGSPLGAPASAVGGYISQVIKSGTYPGFATIASAAGTPGFYHDFRFEAGGASPNRMFSWYAGFDGYDRTYQRYDHRDAGGLSSDGDNPFGFFGTPGNLAAFYIAGNSNGPFAACPNQDASQALATGFRVTPAGPPVCVAYGVQSAGLQVGQTGRDAVLNLHFGIPHRSGGGRDDIGLLYSAGSQHDTYADSIDDLGGLATFGRYYNFLGPALLNYTASGNLATTACFLATNAGHSCASGGPSPFAYLDGYVFAPGTAFGSDPRAAKVVPYLFPDSPANRAMFSGIPLDARSGTWNDYAIVKAQYQKNFGARAYARISAYSFYSDWFNSNPEMASLQYGTGFAGWNASFDYPSPAYELSAHARGLHAEYANQLDDRNLLRADAEFGVTTNRRYNDSTWQADGSGATVTNLVDANGACRSFVTAAVISCFSSSSRGTYADPVRTAYCAAHFCLPAAPGATWMVTQPAGSGPINGVTAKRTSFSISDDLRASDALDLSFGVRFDRLGFDLVDSNTPMMNFWFAAARSIYCYDPVTFAPITGSSSPAVVTPYATTPNGPCPNGPSGLPGLHPDGLGTHLLFAASGASALSHDAISPRFASTYRLDPDTLVRFSAGRYVQAPASAFEQYLDVNGARTAQNDFAQFFALGFTSPVHDNPLQTSTDVDASLEKRMRGTDIAYSATPFYRLSQHVPITVPYEGGSISGVSAGTERVTGVELRITKGNPWRDGWSGALSFTHTDARIRYEGYANGRNAIDTLNGYIAAFDALTRAGGGSPCYGPSALSGTYGHGATDCSHASDVANPYYGMAPQPAMDRTAFYPMYASVPPSDAPATSSTAISPNVLAGWVQWKHDRLSIAPNLTLAEGVSYGSPTDLYGLDPRVCSQNQAQIGVVGAGSPYAKDAAPYSCTSSLATTSGFLAIPDPYLGRFQQEGEYRNPWQLNLGAQIRYRLGERAEASLDVANLFNRCFGGSRTAWQRAFPPGGFTCSYTSNSGLWTGSTPGAGYFYGSSPTDPANGTLAIPKGITLPYTPTPGALPLQLTFQLRVKL